MSEGLKIFDVAAPQTVQTCATATHYYENTCMKIPAGFVCVVLRTAIPDSYNQID